MISPISSARSGRALLIVLVTILAIGLCGVIWLMTRPSTQPSPDEGQKIAESFLKQVVEGHPEQAWDSTTAEFKSAMGRESFVKQAKTTKSLAKPLQFVSMQVVTVQEQPRSEYLFRSVEGSEVRLVLGKDSGAWKVDRWMAER